MKSKNLILAALSAAVCFLAACGTPEQQVATGVYAIGNAVAAKLITSGVPAATVTDIATKLALVPGGTLTPTDYGTLSGEVQQVRNALAGVQASGTVTAASSDYAGIDAFLSGVATGTAQVNAGRAETISQGNVQTVVNQFTNGVEDGVKFSVARNAQLGTPIAK